MADPTIALCPEVLANSFGDSSVSRLEAGDALGRSASVTLTALSNKAKAASEELALKLTRSTSTLSGADRAAGDVVRGELRRFCKLSVSLRLACVSCGKVRRGQL